MVLARIAVPLAVAGLILRRTWPGLTIYFSGDDVMNLYWAWTAHPLRLVLANLVPFTTEYRPLGAALYRILFALFGFHPFPFRLVAYALLLLNAWLLFRFARTLTGSVETAVLASLIGSYHPRFFDLYTNNGAIYDILCYTFFLLALTYYVEHRANGDLTGLRLLVFAALVTAALNAKEMALTLPGVLAAYELIYNRHAFVKSARTAAPALALTVVLTVPALIAKTASGSPMHNHAAYTPRFTARQYFTNTRYMVSDLADMPGARPGVFGVKSRTAVLLWAALFAAALVSRRKHLTFSAAFALLTAIPVMFIPYRGFFVMYLPMAGWAIYAASVAVEARDALLRRPWALRRIALFLVVALLVTRRPPSLFDRAASPSDWSALHRQNRILAETALARRPALPNGARILLVRDSFESPFTPLFLLRLLYRDETLKVERAAAPQPGRYDLVVE